MKPAVVINPNAGALHRDPGLLARLRGCAFARADVHVTWDTTDLTAAAVDLARRDVRWVGLVGGDGTASATLTALASAYGERRLPVICLLRGGTQNTVAGSLGGHRACCLRLLRGMLREIDAPERQTRSRRPTLRAGDRLGFLFGTGVMAGYLDEYSQANGGHPTSATAARVLVHAAASALVDGPKIRSILNETELAVEYEGGHYEAHRYVTVAAATVPDVGLGFRLFSRAFEAEDRFQLLAIHGARPRVAAQLPRVFAGRGLSTRVARQTLTKRAIVTSPEGPFRYFVDGDLHTAPGTLTVDLGPTWSFLHPKPI